MLVDSLPMPPPGSVVGLDIETNFVKGQINTPMNRQMLSIQMSDGQNDWVCLNPDGFASVSPILANPLVTKVFHNGAFDLQFLVHWCKADPHKASLWDTMICERLLTYGTNEGNGLDDVVARRLGVFLRKDIRDSFGTHIGEFSDDQLKYMTEDVHYLPKIVELQTKDINQSGLGRVAALENRLVPMVANMSLLGVGFDLDLWQTYIPPDS